MKELIVLLRSSNNHQTKTTLTQKINKEISSARIKKKEKRKRSVPYTRILRSKQLSHDVLINYLQLFMTLKVQTWSP